MVTNFTLDVTGVAGNNIADAYVFVTPGAGNQIACPGDSGGPLLRQRTDGTWAIVGIVSLGDGQDPNACTTTTENFYTYAPTFRTWAVNHIPTL
jgi:secreted trypsin-like serine protease